MCPELHSSPWQLLCLDPRSEEAAEQTAMAELAALGGVLGEALVAADLPSIVAHKRRAAGGFSSADDEALPGEL